jgi:DNA-binding MarR family transcriptional regulator
MASNDGVHFRSGAQARVQMALLEAIRDQPGGTYATYAELRGRTQNTTGGLIKQFWQHGWVKPDRELPAHWTITEKGEEVLSENADVLA